MGYIWSYFLFQSNLLVFLCLPTQHHFSLSKVGGWRNLHHTDKWWRFLRPSGKCHLNWKTTLVQWIKGRYKLFSISWCWTYQWMPPIYFRGISVLHPSRTTVFNCPPRFSSPQVWIYLNNLSRPKKDNSCAEWEMYIIRYSTIWYAIRKGDFLCSYFLKWNLSGAVKN